MTDTVIIKRIVSSTSTVFNFRGSDLRGRCRRKSIALARQVCMYLIRQETDCALVAVGKELGGRTPATISFGYQRIARSIRVDAQLRSRVESIKQLVYKEN